MFERGGEIVIARVAYPSALRTYPGREAIVRETRDWVRDRLAEQGATPTDDVWSLIDNEFPASEARALHAVLGDIVNRAMSLSLGEESTLDEHVRRWALNGEAEGIVRALTKNRTPVDGWVFARLFEWNGWFPSGAIAFYLWYAPMKTLRSIDPWLHGVAASENVRVHERAFLLRALGRIDAPAAVQVARQLLVESPWATSEVMGMFGGRSELGLMRSMLPVVASREEARTRRHFEAGIRKLERRLDREPR